MNGDEYLAKQEQDIIDERYNGDIYHRGCSIRCTNTSCIMNSATAPYGCNDKSTSEEVSKCRCLEVEDNLVNNIKKWLLAIDMEEYDSHDEDMSEVTLKYIEYLESELK